MLGGTSQQKSVLNKEPDEQLSLEAIQGQKELDRWAAEGLKQWRKLRPDDYDFRIWTKGASKQLLEAGCIYEYVRESRKLRCLIFLMDPARKRRTFEFYTYRSGGRRFKRSCSFEGFGEEDARKRLGRALRWLTGFPGQLAKNTSFAELVRTSEKEVKRSLAEHPLCDPRLKAVQLATSFPFDYGPPPWPWEPWHSESWSFKDGRPVIRPPNRRIGNDGSENIAIQIRWRDFSNRKIGKEMERLARAVRPKVWKKPRRDRSEKILRARLNALSVLRIWKQFPGRGNRWERISEVGECTGYESCVNVSRLEATGTSDAANAEMSRARLYALRFFRGLGTDEMPSNWVGEN